MVKSNRFQSVGISKTHVWSYETFAGMKIQRKHKVLWTVYGFAVVVLLLFCSRELCVRDLKSLQNRESRYFTPSTYTLF